MFNHRLPKDAHLGIYMTTRSTLTSKIKRLKNKIKLDEDSKDSGPLRLTFTSPNVCPVEYL